MSLKFNQVSGQLNSTDTLTFGKYYMCKVEDVLKDDPAYIAYLITNMNISFSEYIKQEAMHRSMPKIRSYFGYSHKGQQEDYWEDVPF
jgi:hypothetical protein